MLECLNVRMLECLEWKQLGQLIKTTCIWCAGAGPGGCFAVRAHPLATLLRKAPRVARRWQKRVRPFYISYGTNVGYGEDGKFSEKSKDGYKKRDSVYYDDCIMREAEKRVKPPPYSLIGWGNPKYNCQDYADALRQKYEELKNDKAIKCKCKKGVE